MAIVRVVLEFDTETSAFRIAQMPNSNVLVFGILGLATAMVGRSLSEPMKSKPSSPIVTLPPGTIIDG